jgi:hypothetical protein
MCVRCPGLKYTKGKKAWSMNVRVSLEATNCQVCSGVSLCTTKAKGVPNMCAACQDDRANAATTGSVPFLQNRVAC